MKKYQGMIYICKMQSNTQDPPDSSVTNRLRQGIDCTSNMFYQLLTSASLEDARGLCKFRWC